ncbi:MAG TPA: branched-chain amino acid ABC transporter ATP-binding protein/permease, partial [Devosia sp.]|nr:branched-chain amino acid ABC transporter ATP-binding protein/permease [Devosia sp.]
VGKNIIRLKLLSFAVSTSLASVAGSLLAHYITFVSPQSFTVEETIFILAMVVLGGTGNFVGSVAGALCLVILPELLKFIDLPQATADLTRNVLYGLILILILRLRPAGLFPERYRLSIPPDLLRAKGSFDLEPFKNARNGEVTLEGKELSKMFGGITAARSVSIELRSGMVTGLIGPNGAGKTTAFNLLTGFLAPTSGSIVLRNKPIVGMPPHQIVRAGVARTFQDLRLFKKMPVIENVLVAFPNQAGDSLWNVFFARRRVAAEERRNIARALNILDFVGLRSKAEQDAAHLSYAEEKLLVIARLLATEAEVLLLDEPLAGLAPNTLEEVLPIIRKLAERGRTVCLIEHNLEVISAACDTVSFIDAGEVVASGRPAELMQNSHLLERYIR